MRHKERRQLSANKEDAHIFFFPLAEIDFERGHGELLAHPPLIMHRFRDQRGVLWAVPAHRGDVTRLSYGRRETTLHDMKVEIFLYIINDSMFFSFFY